jgi:hypothetical protein
MFITVTSKATFHLVPGSSPSTYIYPSDDYLPTLCDELYDPKPTSLTSGQYCENHCKNRFLVPDSPARKHAKEAYDFVPPTQEAEPTPSSDNYYCDSESVFPLCSRQTRAAGCDMKIVRRRSQTDAAKPAYDEWELTVADGCPGDDAPLEVGCPTSGRMEVDADVAGGRVFSFRCDCSPATSLKFVFGGHTAGQVMCASYDELAIGESTPPRDVCGGGPNEELAVSSIISSIYVSNYYGVVTPTCTVGEREGACLSASACTAAGSSEWVASSDGAEGCYTYGTTQCCVGVTQARLQRSVSTASDTAVTLQPFTAVNSNTLLWGDFCDTLTDAVDNVFEEPGFCKRRCNEIADKEQFTFRQVGESGDESSSSVAIIVAVAVAAVCCGVIACAALAAVIIARRQATAKAAASAPSHTSGGRRSHARSRSGTAASRR